MQRIVVLYCLVALCLFGASCYGTNYDIYPTTSNWISILQGLVAGDRATLHAGTYSKTSRLALNLTGTATSPIVITGAANEAAAIIKHTDQNQNIVELTEGNYFTVQNLTLTGGSLGLRLGPSASNSLKNGVIQYLTVHDTAETAISANFEGMTYTNLTFRHNEVYNTGTNTGECFYLGCADAGCHIQDSFILDNLCHDTQQATSGSVGSAFQIKDGSFNNLVQDNVCYNLGGPCVLLYTDQGKGRNRAIGNVVLSTNDNGIQAAAGALIANNIILNTGGDGISIIKNPSTAVNANITIAYNTIYNSGGFSLRLTMAASTSNINFNVANNALYNEAGSAVQTSGTNTGVGYYNNGFIGGSAPSGAPTTGFFALGTAANDLTSPSTYNVYPKSTTSKLLNKGDVTHNAGITYDFNNKPRATTTPTVGAYQYSTATNPGWAVSKAFKPSQPNH